MAAVAAYQHLVPRELYSLHPKFIFGLTAGIANSCLFQSDDVVIYQVAGVLVAHNIREHTQKFLYLNEAHKVITTMDICLSRNLIALAERGDPRPSISLYSLKDMRLVRQLVLPFETNANCFIKLKFSYDGVFLAALADSPDYVMYYYDWNQSKVESHVQVISPTNEVGLVSEMALNPFKNRLCLFVGKGMFRLMYMGELIWKQYGFHKGSKFNFTTACWLNEFCAMAGTADGRLFVIENGELRAVYNDVPALMSFDLKYVNPNPLIVEPPLAESAWEIRHITNVGDSLMFVVDGNRIFYYTSEGTTFVRSEVYCIPQETNKIAIHTLSVSPKNKFLVCLTDNLQLFLMPIGLRTDDDDDVAIIPFGAAVHQGGVSGLSICHWTTTFMTTGKTDRTVKLWDYHQCKLLFSKQYRRDVLDVSMHPSGLYVLLAFSIYVSLVVMSGNSGMVTRMKFPAVDCNLVRFSDAGHLFAMVNDGELDVYCALTYVKLHVLSYHKPAIITDIAWSGNDWMLYSSDSRGDVYQFDLYTNRHAANITHIEYGITGIAVSTESKKIYTASADGRIREVYGNVVIRDKDLDLGSIDAIALAKTGLMLFAACEDGVVLSLSSPMKSKIEYKAFNVHNKTVTKMKQTSDDATLITCSSDGSICIWTVRNAKEKDVKRTLPVLRDKTIISWHYLNHSTKRIRLHKWLMAELNRKKNRDVANLKLHYQQQMSHVPVQLMVDYRRMMKEKKEHIAMYDSDTLRLENQKKTVVENHEYHEKTVRKHYEKLLQTENDDYAQIELDMANARETAKRDGQTMTETMEKTKQELTDKLHGDIKYVEDDLQNLKGQLSGEYEQLRSRNEELHVQLERKMTKAIGHQKKEIQKLSAGTEVVQRVQEEIERKLYQAEIVLSDASFLHEKYIDMQAAVLKSADALDEKLANKENELLERNKMIKNKNEEMKEIAATMADMEKTILVFRCNLQEQANVVDPLKRRLAAQELYHLDLTQEYDGTLASKHTKNETVLKLKQKINTVAWYSRQISRNLRYGVKVFRNNIDMDLQRIFKDYPDDVVKLKENVQRLHSRLANTNPLANVKMSLPRQRVFLEKCLEHGNNDKAIAARRPSAHFETLRDNLYLTANLNKLMRDLEVNVQIYKDLEIAVRRSKKKKKNRKNRNPSDSDNNQSNIFCNSVVSSQR